MVIDNPQKMQDDIDYEMVNTYLKQSRLASYCAFLLVPYIGFSFYHLADTRHILIWMSLVCSLDAIIVFTSSQFNKDVPKYRVKFFKTRQEFLHLLIGFAWGSIYLLVSDAKHPRVEDYQILAVMGVVMAFSATTMSGSVRGLVAFACGNVFFAMLYFLSNFEHFRWWFFVTLGLLAFGIYSGWRANRYILGLVESQLLNATYVEELQSLNDKVQRTNQDFIKRNVELQSMQHQLQILATFDELTGLHNRRYILERTEEKLPEIKRHNLDCCFVMMDVDHFKSINDVYGHSAGDQVLRTLARVLTNELRQGDIHARYGGEEFLIMLPMTELASAEALVERLRLAIQKQTFMFDGEEVSVTASFGITRYAMTDTVDKVIDRADKALYQAKISGRNRTVIIPNAY